MSLYFLINNFHFALELMGAVVFLMCAWLTVDTYVLHRENKTLARALGFGLIALWQFMYALNIGNDVVLYAGFIVYTVGLLFLGTSFLGGQKLQMQEVVVIPAFEALSAYLHTFAALLLFAIAYISFQHSREEHNRTWIPFSIAFVLLGVSGFLQIYAGTSAVSVMALSSAVFEFLSFILLAQWVWQFLQLRIRESLILLFVSVALFLSVVVTLAFSTILIAQITTETQSNLLTDAQVLSLDIDGLKEQSLAKTALVANDPLLKNAVANNDFASLSQIAEGDLETYNLGFLTVVDAQGNVLVRAHALSRRGDSLVGERALEEALKGNTFVTVEDSAVEKLSIRAGSPLVQNKKIIGAVIAGYPLDNALVDNIKRVTGLDLFIYDKTTAVSATALATDGRTRMTGVELANQGVQTSVFSNEEPATAQVTFYGQPFLASYLPLVNGDDKVIGVISAAKPEQDILDIANSTNRLTLITVLIIMLILIIPIYLVTKRLSDEE